MKKITYLLILSALFSAFLGACQTSQAEDDSMRSPERASDMETAYPAEEEPAVQGPEELDAAYPIKEEDLKMLHKTWELDQYYEDGVEQDPTLQSLQFNPDGTYEMKIENGSRTGNWNARLSSLDSILILTNEIEDPLTYEIITLEVNRLILQSWQESTQIEQQFQPAE